MWRVTPSPEDLGFRVWRYAGGNPHEVILNTEVDMRFRMLRPVTALCFLLIIGLWASPESAPAQDKIAVIASDFSSGFLSTMEAEPNWDTEINVASTHSDARLRVRQRLIYVVNRFLADNIHCFDPDNGYDTVCQETMGSGSNPSDIIFCSDDKAFVPRYDSAWLYVVNPQDCTVIDSIFLGDLADGDGLPEMDYGIEVDGRVFVNIQRLDRDNFYIPTPPSYLAVIDCETETLLDADPNEPGVQGIELLGTNPYTRLQRDPTDGNLLVGTVGGYGILDGGIERVDPASLVSAGWMIREEELGGDILAFRVVDAQHGYAVISDANFNACLVAFDPSSGTFQETLFCTDGFNISQHLVVHDGLLFAGDRTITDPGLRVFDIDTGNLVAGPIYVGLPPDAMALLRESTSGVGEGSFPRSPFRLDLPYPNPAMAAATVPIHMQMEGRITLGLFDAAGRRLRTFPNRWLERGRHEIQVGGITDFPAGVYWIRILGTKGGGGVRLMTIR
jgi:hypothetical protein